MSGGRLTLQGLETEYGFSALDAEGKRCDKAALARLIDVVGHRVPAIHSKRGGLFMSNGGLLYVDAGDHLEWATPECTSPAEMVKYLCAGEKLIAAAVDELEGEHDYSRVQVFKGNVCYTVRDVTWGCHESYLYRNFRLTMPGQLIPFLISRVIFTGAGGLSTTTSGIRFELSPRVAHLHHEISCNSTDNRAIFHTKNESLTSFGYKRLHLICGDSNCSQFQTWLKTGTTMLVVALVDAGVLPGAALKFEDGVCAMRHFSTDVGCAEPLTDQENVEGIRAIDIQHSYLETAERYLGTALMPDWAEEVCTAWRATLAALAADPGTLIDKLDWPLKYALFEQRVKQHVIGTMENVALWNSVLLDVENEMAKNPRHSGRLLTPAIINQYRRRVGRIGNTVRRGADRLKEHGFDWDQLEQFLALRWELCELDMSFTDVSERGVFNTLDQAGTLKHRIVEDQQCVHGTRNPPAEGRAKLRGEAIKDAAVHKDTPVDCDWQGIFVGDSMLDLGDPFAREASWSDRKRGRTGLPPSLQMAPFLRGL